jgi:HD superfamily phosphohydrolase
MICEINDPVFGVININDKFIYSIIQHLYFQRLMRIKQLGLAYFIYPTLKHSRMDHSLGAMYLMSKAIYSLRFKGHIITQEEEQAALACILMHDLGHTPFSHTLEKVLIKNISHEEISLLLMLKINKMIGEGSLNLAIELLKNEYKKNFLCQLISCQIDIDRLDNLRRDSFFCGFADLNIDPECIIKTLDVRNGSLVVDIKGVSLIKNFFMLRKFMFLKVYFNKAVIVIEKMLIRLFDRARILVQQGVNLFVSPSLYYFFYEKIDKETLMNNLQIVEHFINLCDDDILSAIEVWSRHSDKIISLLSNHLLHRKLFQIETKSTPFDIMYVYEKQKQIANMYHISLQEASYLVCNDEAIINVYDNESKDGINILYENETIQNISKLPDDVLNIKNFSEKIKKYYLYYIT